MSNEEGLSNITQRNVRHNFLPSGMIIDHNNNSNSEDQEEELKNEIKEFQGDTKAGKLLYINLQINNGVYTRGIGEYERLNADQWMEASWLAMKNYAMSGKMNLDAAAAAQYATTHLISDYVKRNIYNAKNDALFDANGKLIASRLPGYDDLDWQDGVEP